MSSAEERVRAHLDQARIETRDPANRQAIAELIKAVALLAELRAPEPGVEAEASKNAAFDEWLVRNQDAHWRSFSAGWDAALRAARGGR